jgi:hypothetical protein
MNCGANQRMYYIYFSFIFQRQFLNYSGIHHRFTEGHCHTVNISGYWPAAYLCQKLYLFYSFRVGKIYGKCTSVIVFPLSLSFNVLSSNRLYAHLHSFCVYLFIQRFFTTCFDRIRNMTLKCYMYYVISSMFGTTCTLQRMESG